MSLVAIAAALSIVLVGLVRWDALRRGVIDAPTERSSHERPTPRGGGVGLIASMGIVMLWLGAHSGASSAALSAALSVALVGTIGWIDDHRGAPVRWRLLVHLLAGVLMLPLAVGAPLPLPTVVSLVWWAFWTISSINVVNFMDGIDGIIGLQGLIFGLFCMRLAVPGGEAATLGAILAGASAGFLAWNWSPARIFMGDVGSGGLGVIFVALGALLVREGRVGFVAAFAPLAPIFLDASATLVARARRGERLSEAHRSHLYQRLANGGMGHARVTLLYATASALVAVAAAAYPRGGLSLLLSMILGLSGAALVLRRWSGARNPALLP